MIEGDLTAGDQKPGIFFTHVSGGCTVSLLGHQLGPLHMTSLGSLGLLSVVYIPTILISTHSRIQFRGCGNLAKRIGSSMKSFY